jgi:lipopolysaccharide transport system permease protein
MKIPNSQSQGPNMISARFSALWQYRSFVFSMVKREFRGRYLGSLLGSLWSILNPIAMIFIYTVIFSQVMRARLVSSNDTWAYGVFLCSGLLTWNYFSELLLRCQTMFIEQAGLLKKVNFPRITLPVIILFSSTINFVIIFGIFLLFLLVTGRFPGLSLFGILPLLLIQQTFALGLGALLGTMNVFFRDIGHLVGIAVQFWFWLTPIIYPITILPERIQQLIMLNPMTQVVMSYQQILLYNRWPNWENLQIHIVGALLILGIGFSVFQRLSGELVDEL